MTGQFKGLQTVEVDDWAAARTCPKCGGQNHMVHGFVLLDGQRHATYFAELPGRSAAHTNPRVGLALGFLDPYTTVARPMRFVAMQAWPRKDSNIERNLRTLMERRGLQEKMGPLVSLKVLDPQNSPWASGNVVPSEFMNRAEVLADPDKGRFFIAADMAARYDPRVASYLAESRSQFAARSSHSTPQDRTANTTK